MVRCGRDPDRIAAAAVEVGHDAIGLVADVGTPDGAADFVAQATDRLGGIDVLITNAGGPPPGTFATTPVDAYASALDLNLTSVVAMCKAAVPAMQSQGWGRVVAITSISVRQPIANLILSNTARAGVTGFLKTLAREDGVFVSDRKVVKLYKLLRARAWLFHGGRVEREDLTLLSYLGETREELALLEDKVPKLLGLD